jgi:hypothetical protein
MVSMIPCVIIYAVLQRYYVAGMLSGGIKQPDANNQTSRPHFNDRKPS